MRRSEYDRIARAGFYSVAPFVAAAVAVWLSPMILPQHLALDIQRAVLVYAALLSMIVAGIGACADLTSAAPAGGRRTLGPLIAAFFAALLAILPNGVFFINIGGTWRYVIMLLVLIFLLTRDLDAVRAGQLPRWYGDLRARLTFWMVLSITLIVARLMIWGHY